MGSIRSRHGRDDAGGHGSAQPVAPAQAGGRADPALPLAALRALLGTGNLRGLRFLPLRGRPAQPCVPPASASSNHCARVGYLQLRLLACGQALRCEQAPHLAPGRAGVQESLPGWFAISPALPASSRAGMTAGLPSPRGQVPGLAVPGRQQAVLALAASPSAASSPGEGSFVPWASSPAVAPVVRGHWRFPGSCGWVWAGWHGGVWGGMAEEGAAILQVLGQKGGPMAKGSCGALLPRGHRQAQWCPEVG